MSKIKLAIGFPKKKWELALTQCSVGAIEMIEEFLKDVEMNIRDRAHCETDDTWLQLLPYVVIMNHQGKYLTYRRPDTGDEPALHGMYSIGFGGHMDKFDDDDNLMNIAKNARRELLEELPLAKHYSIPREFKSIVREDVPYSHDIYLSELLYGPLFFNNMASFVNKTEGADKFHLGLILPIRIDECILDLSLNNSEVEDMSWKSEFELRDMKLESWSREYIHNDPRSNVIFRDSGPTIGGTPV